MPRNSPSTSESETWTLCDGLFSMPVPEDWTYDPSGYTDGSFRLPSGQQLSCQLRSFEAPEAIADRAFSDFIREPGLDVPPLGEADITGNVLMFVNTATDSAPGLVVWKTLDILDSTHIRVARFSLPFDPDGDDEPSPESGIAGDITAAINQGRFASQSTPLDRVAPSKTLKRVAPWGLIHMRVPEHWRYERVEDGRFVCDVLPEQMPPDPTLWFDYDQFIAPSDPPDMSRHLRETATNMAESLGPPDGVKVDHDAAGSWIEAVSHGYSGDTPVVDYLMHRLVGDGRVVMIAHFNFVLTADDARTKAGQELVALIHHEIRNAIVLAGPPDD